MKKNIVGIMLAIAFIIGCGASIVAQNYVVPPAVAQNTQAWDYTCTTIGGNPEDYTATLKEHGAQGWEAIFVKNTKVCFKRPM